MYDEKKFIVVADKTENTPPYPYYFVDALGQMVFVKTRDRAEANKMVVELYGFAKYNIRTQKTTGSRGNVTCRGTQKRAAKKS